MSHVYTSVDRALPELARTVLQAPEVGARGGQRTKEALFQQVTLGQPQLREVTLPERGASLPAQIAETMWVLAGRDDIGWLSHYLPRAKDFSDDGMFWRAAYGPRIRSWGQGQDQDDDPFIDQLAEVVKLLRADRLTRRAVISLFDPQCDFDPDTKDVPCNNWLHFLSRDGKLDLHVATRSNDLIWGWSGINAFEWSVLQELVAGLLGIRVGALHFSISSLHVYDRHWAKAERIRDARPPVVQPYPSPALDASTFGCDLDQFDGIVRWWFQIEKMIRDGNPDRELIELFPEPMLRSWLRVLDWWWNGDEQALEPLAGTRLEVAARLSPGRPSRAQEQAAPAGEPFLNFVMKLHADKHAAYGDSWKRRGEQMGIMANIARKVDRLGVAGGGDTSADTAIDLLVYLVKYRLWLSEEQGVAWPVAQSDHVTQVNDYLKSLSRAGRGVRSSAAEVLQIRFGELEQLVTNGATGEEKIDPLIPMLNLAYPYAKQLWLAEQSDDYRGADHD